MCCQHCSLLSRLPRLRARSEHRCAWPWRPWAPEHVHEHARARGKTPLAGPRVHVRRRRCLEPGSSCSPLEGEQQLQRVSRDRPLPSSADIAQSAVASARRQICRGRVIAVRSSNRTGDVRAERAATCAPTCSARVFPMSRRRSDRRLRPPLEVLRAERPTHAVCGLTCPCRVEWFRCHRGHGPPLTLVTPIAGASAGVRKPAVINTAVKARVMGGGAGRGNSAAPPTITDGTARSQLAAAPQAQ